MVTVIEETKNNVYDQFVHLLFQIIILQSVINAVSTALCFNNYKNENKSVKL
jgi:hypothetical protein